MREANQDGFQRPSFKWTSGREERVSFLRGANFFPQTLPLDFRYSRDLLLALILTVGLNVLDSLFTMIILEEGGREVNPIVRAAIAVWGDRFWIWKFALVSVNLVLLCLLSHMRIVRTVIFGICFVYIAVIMYQVALLQRIFVS